LVRIHFLLEVTPEYSIEDKADRLQKIFSQNSLTEFSSLYLLRDGKEIPEDYLRRFNSQIRSYRSSYMMHHMHFRETAETRDLQFFLPVYPRSLKIAKDGDTDPPRQSVFFFINKDLVESQGTHKAPFIIRYFDQIIKEGRMPDVREIIYLYPRLGEQELIMMSRTLS
jgi:hypothetical protein